MVSHNERAKAKNRPILVSLVSKSAMGAENLASCQHMEQGMTAAKDDCHPTILIIEDDDHNEETERNSDLLQLVAEFGGVFYRKSFAYASWMVDYSTQMLIDLDQAYLRRAAPNATSTKGTHPGSNEEDPSCSSTHPTDVEDEELGDQILVKKHSGTKETDDGFQSEHLGDSRQYWRDIILGVNDGCNGLVSTFLLVAGVTGASLSNKDILLTAIAGTIAGAISMSAGEYIATKTQEEVFDGEVGIERSHIARHREQELGELRECFEKIGIVCKNDSDTEEVEDLNRRLLDFYSKRDNAHLLAHMVLEFGILEDEKRNPLIAGSVAFVLFVCGALPSVLPFTIFDNITVAFIAAGILTMSGLLMVGAIKTWATRGNLWNAAFENLAVSAGGGAIAFGIGFAFEQLLVGKD